MQLHSVGLRAHEPRCLYVRVCSNAGKFTPRGAIAVDVAVVHGDCGDVFVTITVTNTRSAPAIQDTEPLFIPFRGSYSGAPHSARTPGACGRGTDAVCQQVDRVP
jgi:hypothetical protein